MFTVAAHIHAAIGCLYDARIRDVELLVQRQGGRLSRATGAASGVRTAYV